MMSISPGTKQSQMDKLGKYRPTDEKITSYKKNRHIDTEFRVFLTPYNWNNFFSFINIYFFSRISQLFPCLCGTVYVSIFLFLFSIQKVSIFSRLARTPGDYLQYSWCSPENKKNNNKISRVHAVSNVSTKK